MYWYSIKSLTNKAAVVCTTVALCLSCTSGANDEQVTREVYFDLPAYFEAEIARLKSENPVIEKTVVKDSVSETKALRIANWESELSSFVSVDLNKPAYAGVLKKDSTRNKVTIRCTDPEIDIALVEIEYGDQGEPTAFHIQRNIQNSLYESHENLHYASGQSYSVAKHQSVLVLGEKYYHIKGNFKSQTGPAK